MIVQWGGDRRLSKAHVTNPYASTFQNVIWEPRRGSSKILCRDLKGHNYFYHNTKISFVLSTLIVLQK